ncbi:DUF1771-domain-containing protein [Ophiobolus disseminans]|uniref:DUF1771-domain-containing protein n=1 Tax=Ophiobolus disseminans TaxID=1469910 RepID=A0A6A6ZPN0_9PLEO|nr:DUF1771-domain-containing protein [Ophiobolus disseminans]
MATRSRSPSGYPDTTSINLNRLLSRLERIVLVDPTPQLRKSTYERARVSANIEHARTLLLNLEHAASTIPSKSKKAALQTDLQQKRELIKQLNQRIYELNQLDDTDSEASMDSDDEDEDQFPSYAPRIQAEAGRDVSTSNEGNEALRNAAENLTSQLRRRGKPEDVQGAQTASGNSLFPSKASTTTGDPNAPQTEALLSHDRNEQESLTSSLLDMAKQLKQQSLHFNQTLEGDKSVLDRAVSGLDSNQLGMDAASRRMGTLRRMTEGRGWFARMKLYALIFGLWVIAFLIVFPCSHNPINQYLHLHVYRLHIFVELSYDADIQSDLDPAPSRMLALASITSCRLRKLKSNNTTTSLRRNTARHSSRCRDNMAAMEMFSLGSRNLNHSSSDTEAEYDRLRDLARQEAAKRSSCFDRAHQAYESGDGGRAHDLSEEGKQHAAKMEQYNRQARDYIFRENNATGRVAGDTIDLHGLFVEEAEDILEERIKAARQRGETHLHVIVGKGNHSKNHVQKIKPRVEQVCRELGLQYRTEENEGRMFVNLQGGGVDHMPPPPQAPSYGGYPGQHGGGQQHGGQHGGGHGQQHGGQHQQQGQNDEIEQMVKKGLPKLLKKLGCCTVM